MFTERKSFIKDNFGSKRGLLKSVEHQLLLLSGIYSKYKDFDFGRVSRVIFVCSGNICRSPLGEAVAAHKGMRTASYGLHCRGGDKADPRAMSFAKSIGLSLENHITRNISEYKNEAGDLIIGMEPQHAHEIKNLFPGTSMITLAGLWLTTPRPYLHDPYNTSSEFFNKCERLVVESTEAIHRNIKT